MSEKRFIVIEEGVEREDTVIEDTITKERYNEYGVVELLNEQQATIRKLQDLCGESDSENAKLQIKNNEQQYLIINLQGDVNRLQYIIDELRKDNYKRFEKINELKAKLKEKEEDEKNRLNEEYIKECSMK